MQDDVKALNKIVTEQAVQNVRLDTQEQRLNDQARLIDDLRRGEGMILPIEPHLGRIKPNP